ncbi:Leucyl/phenylalanyl-tRNA--protein transferase [Vibrio palustris]|uniref:Leucyl/phenylalanyl-tRNA--protein transferase n=2 Tax=Vibrio palustris TaxID=1918946 RepID=A0A1R4B306_9VIBR|nr:Leucyl/phenylalanyl-tRNA--protein transferase [Vibrio palustris]
MDNGLCMTIYLTELAPDDYTFPAPHDALDEPNGLLAIGGDLHPQRLVAAYRSGIFPWYGPGEPILWWSPAPRAVFNTKTFKPSKSLKKFHKKSNYTVSLNRATSQVIEFCAAVRPASETWLNDDMRHAYQQLALQGNCHSVEVWLDGELIGGLYGIMIGQIFCGESMFSLRDNASKIALWHFCEYFQQLGGQWIDCQVMNPHLASLGAQELSREQFLEILLCLRDNAIDSQYLQPRWLTHSTTSISDKGSS